MQTSSSSTYRKVIILDASDMSTEGSFHISEFSSYYYAMGIDADDTNGDLYIAYRDYYGRTREYTRGSGGGYSASDYRQFYTYARYHHALDVQDDYVYTSGFYYSSWYGGMKKCSTSSSSCSTLWSSYSGANGYKGSVATTDTGDIYVASNYAFSYYSFSNRDDKSSSRK